MEVEKSIRYRITVSTSVKGVKTWDCTVDGEYNTIDPNHSLREDFGMQEVLEKSDALVEKLEKRYPTEVITK